jgi:hypothetical protein
MAAANMVPSSYIQGKLDSMTAPVTLAALSNDLAMPTFKYFYNPTPVAIAAANTDVAIVNTAITSIKANLKTVTDTTLNGATTGAVALVAAA